MIVEQTKSQIHMTLVKHWTLWLDEKIAAAFVVRIVEFMYSALVERE